MDMPIQLYKKLIDDLVDQRDCVLAKRVREKHRLCPQVIASLSEEVREVIAEMLQDARDGGIHDTLVYLNEEMTLNEMRIVVDDTDLPVEPFGTEMFYDWVARCDGSTWPDEK